MDKHKNNTNNMKKTHKVQKSRSKIFLDHNKYRQAIKNIPPGHGQTQKHTKNMKKQSKKCKNQGPNKFWTPKHIGKLLKISRPMAPWPHGPYNIC